MSRLTSGMKQRLVGAVVLGALAIIFIPILLDGEGLNDPGLARVIPPPPAVPPVPDFEPHRPRIEADQDPVPVTPAPAAVPPPDLVTLPPPAAENPEPAASPSPPPRAEPASPEPALDLRGLPEAWQVRLATFADAANAQGLVTRLLNAGHKAYSRPVPSPQGTLTAVYVGPVLTRNEADTLRERLAESFRLEGLVVKFAIETPPAP